MLWLIQRAPLRFYVVIFFRFIMKTDEYENEKRFFDLPLPILEEL